jgi:hypothetical protein
LKRIALSLLLSGLAASAPCSAIDGYFVDAGGNNRLQIVKAGMIRQWQQQWLDRDHWHLTGYWEAALAYLHSDGSGGKGLADASLIPVFRFRPDASGGIQPYLDGGVGAHLLSDSKIDKEHDFGGPLQLGALIGLGVTFGEKSQYDFGYRFQYVTNTGLSKPTSSFNLHEFRLTFLY